MESKYPGAGYENLYFEKSSNGFDYIPNPIWELLIHTGDLPNTWLIASRQTVTRYFTYPHTYQVNKAVLTFPLAYLNFRQGFFLSLGP